MLERTCNECVESNDINRLRLYSRPKCVDEVAFQEEVVAVLKKSLEGADVSIKRSWCLFYMSVLCSIPSIPDFRLSISRKMLFV